MPSARRGVFRPVLCWLALSAVLFLGQYHQTQARKATMEFTLFMEGGDELILPDVTLNGQPYMAGLPCGVGWKKLVVQTDGAEPFETNSFIWYRGEAFGNITLTRTRGRLDLDFSPAAETVGIIGSGVRKNLTNITHESVSLPTGRYTVQAKFTRFTEERTVELIRNQTNLVAVAPSITTLNLSSDPDKAEFELRSTQPPEVSVRGSTPAAITDLPAGEYELAIARGDYRKNLPVKLTGMKATNELMVEFRYARLLITSEPTGAAISDGGRVIGQTPASLELQPGLYNFQILKKGYFGTNVSLTLLETNARTVSVSLVNVSYVEAIERARQRALGGVDDDRALADLEQALQIKPGDETALALKREIAFDRHLRNAWLSERKGDVAKALSEVEAALKLNASDAKALAMKSDLEKAQRATVERRTKADQAAAATRANEQRKRPEKLFRDIAASVRHFELFSNQLLRCSGAVDTAHAKVVRALGRDPAWSILRNDSLSDEIRVIHAETKGFGWKQYVVLVLGQAADNEVVVYFKLFSFTADAAYLAEGGYKPVHPRYASAGRASTVEAYLNKDVQEFTKRIEEELR